MDRYYGNGATIDTLEICRYLFKIGVRDTFNRFVVIVRRNFWTFSLNWPRGGCDEQNFSKMLEKIVI